ncbi:unnamed protein product [Schistosoma margrebowiei]|uniref:Uncharacterized protein n=1 Tax=Schistosoma margrebowiei TaxID=48269 RepID=A0A183N638_9TREM|nr:unnamed protein product [Schistosoma margrebowiei]
MFFNCRNAALALPILAFTSSSDPPRLSMMLSTLIINFINCNNEEDESDLSIITEELMNAGFDYANLLHKWFEKNIGKNEMKIIKQNLAKLGKLAFNFIDSTIQNLIKDDDDDNDNEDHDHDHEYNDSQLKHNEL